MRKELLAGIAAAFLMAGGGISGAQQESGVPSPGNLNASITFEQKQRIRQAVFADHGPRMARVDFSLTIGNVVPPDVPTAPVPEAVAKAFPDWHAYAYFVVQDRIQDQIIVLNPRDRTIVAIIA